MRVFYKSLLGFFEQSLNIFCTMKNKASTSRGVVEDIWMNTKVGLDDVDRLDPEDPAGVSDWNEIEECNIILSPDPVGMYRG